MKLYQITLFIINEFIWYYNEYLQFNKYIIQLYIINNSIYDSQNNNYFKLKTSVIVKCYDINDIIIIERNDLIRVIIQVTIMSYTTDTTILCLSFQSP